MLKMRIIKTLMVINETEQGHEFAYSLFTQWRAKRFLTPRQWAAAERLCQERGFDTLYRPRTTPVMVAKEIHELPEGWPVIATLGRHWSDGINAPVLAVDDVQCGLDMSTGRGRSRREKERILRAVLIATNPPMLLGEVDHTGIYEPCDRGAFPRMGVIDRVRGVFDTIRQGDYHMMGTIWKI